MLVAPAIGLALALLIGGPLAVGVVFFFLVPSLLTAGAALALRCGWWTLALVFVTLLVSAIAWLAAALWAVSGLR